MLLLIMANAPTITVLRHDYGKGKVSIGQIRKAVSSVFAARKVRQKPAAKKQPDRKPVRLA